MEANNIRKAEINFNSVRKRNAGCSKWDKSIVGKNGNGRVT